MASTTAAYVEIDNTNNQNEMLWFQVFFLYKIQFVCKRCSISKIFVVKNVGGCITIYCDRYNSHRIHSENAWMFFFAHFYSIEWLKINIPHAYWLDYIISVVVCIALEACSMKGKWEFDFETDTCHLLSPGNLSTYDKTFSIVSQHMLCAQWWVCKRKDKTKQTKTTCLQLPTDFI